LAPLDRKELIDLGVCALGTGRARQDIDGLGRTALNGCTIGHSGKTLVIEKLIGIADYIFDLSIGRHANLGAIEKGPERHVRLIPLICINGTGARWRIHIIGLTTKVINVDKSIGAIGRAERRA
jgi:hypothetical protein